MAYNPALDRPDPVREVQRAIGLFREFLDDVDRLGCKILKPEEEMVSSEFIREVLRPRVLTVIIEHEEIVWRAVTEMPAEQARVIYWPPARERFEKELGILRDDLKHRYEIQAIELAKQEPRKPANERESFVEQFEPENSVAGDSFTQSGEYRSVSVRGKTYVLTSRQAQMIQLLDEARKNGKPDVAIDHIMEKLGSGSSRWQDTWKSGREARKALIKSGARKGTLRLNL